MEFHETDVGKFHRALSVIVLAVALVFCVAGSIAWRNKSGHWLLMVATAIGVLLICRTVRDFDKKPCSEEDSAMGAEWDNA
jgi:hypothetical protein